MNRTGWAPEFLAGCLRFHLPPALGQWSLWRRHVLFGCRFPCTPHRTSRDRCALASWRWLPDPVSEKIILVRVFIFYSFTQNNLSIQMEMVYIDARLFRGQTIVKNRFVVRTWIRVTAAVHKIGMNHYVLKYQACQTRLLHRETVVPQGFRHI